MFWDLHKKKLADFKLQLFKFRALSKSNVIGDVKMKCPQPGDLAIDHDFTESLTSKKSQAVQSDHFGGCSRVSIEGHVFQHPSGMSGNLLPLVFDFCSFLSDDRTWIASTVHRHMDKLVKHLLDEEVLQCDGKLMVSTDGCAKQHKCANCFSS